MSSKTGDKMQKNQLKPKANGKTGDVTPTKEKKAKPSKA
jgi:hypothetical protein